MRVRAAGAGALVGCALFAVAALGADGAPSREQLTEEVRAVELAFAASVAGDDREAFASFLDVDAVFVSGARATVGREAILEAWKGYFGPDRAELTWSPELVELSGDGTLGLTRGPWTYRGKSAEGEVVEQSGIFNSVWRRQADGSWKVVFDAGCSPCPECGEGP